MRRSQYPKIPTVSRPEGWSPKLKGDESLGEWLKQTVYDKQPGDLKMSSIILRKTTIRDRGEAKRYRPLKKSSSTEGCSERIERKNLGFDDRDLCYYCSKITIKRLLDAAYVDFTKVSDKLGGHHYNPHELEESALQCPLCRLFVLSFDSNFRSLLKVSSPPTPGDARGHCRFKVWARSMDIESRKKEEERNIQVLVLEWIDGASEFISELMIFADKGSEAAVKGKISTTFHQPKLSRETLGRSIPYLLRLCHSKHSSCRGSLFSPHSSSPYTSLPETKLPSRVIVIDWKKHGRDGPFLMESAGKFGIYATLSHCWGDPDTMPKTTRSTLEENKEALGLDSSSARERTICEAIDVCKELKIPYLWVDAFCIVQHDSDDPESDLTDWEWEALDMGRIYRDSALTIAAAGASDDPTNGLYGDRLGKTQYVRIPFKARGLERRRPRSKSRVEEVDEEDLQETETTRKAKRRSIDSRDQIHAKGNDADVTGTDDKGTGARAYEGSDDSDTESDESSEDDDDYRGDFYVGLPPRGFDDEVTDSRLLTRGWVLQERLLSPRYLYFGKDQWFWQCRQLTFAEVVGFENGAMKVGADLGFSTIMLKDRIKFALWWTKIVETYSRLDFTVQSDRAIALTGLLTELRRAIPQEYHHGLWAEKFYIQLLWGVSNYSVAAHTKDPSKSKTGHSISKAPSWSWQSCESPVTYSDHGEQKYVYEPTYDEVQQKYLDYPDTKIIRPMIEHRMRHDKSGNRNILIVRGQVLEARISNLNSTRTGSRTDGLIPDRIGPLESMAKRLHSVDYPTTPLQAIEGKLKGQEVAKCKLDDLEHFENDTCFCLRVCDFRNVGKGREKTYAMDILLVVPVQHSEDGTQYRRIGVGTGTSIAVSWFLGSKPTQISIV